MSLASLLVPSAAALILSFLAVPAVRRFAVRAGAVSQPGGRHIHAKATPKLGGLAVAGSFFAVVLAILLLSPDELRFVPQHALGIDRNLFGVLLGALILVGTGIADDRFDLNPWLKLTLQAAACCCVVAFGVTIHWLSNPFGGNAIILGGLSYVLVPAWLLLMINATNLIDGLDGLAAGLSAIAAAVMVFLSLQPVVNQPATALLAAILTGAILGFLPYNWNPAKIFLGDTGSMFLGYMVGVFAIISGAKFATAALVLGLPILDTGWVFARRLLSGQSPMKADMLHLHHRFLRAGFSPRATVLILYAVAALSGMIALVSGTQGKTVALAGLAAAAVLLAIGLVAAGKRRTG